MLDHIVRIDDEGGAISDACILGDDAKRVGEFLLVVGDPGEIAVGEPLVRLAPCEVAEIGVGGSADQHRIPAGEVALQIAIADDLGRADEGEVLRPVEHDLPRSDEHTSELQSLMRISSAVFCLKKKTSHIK